MQLLASRFVEAVGPSTAQIVSLGAGSDTLYFRLRDQAATPAPGSLEEQKLSAAPAPPPTTTAALATATDPPEAAQWCQRYCELDLPAVVDRKKRVLGSKFSTSKFGDLSPVSPYRLVAADLRRPAAVLSALKEAGIDPRLPTLFIAECVLVYLASDESAELLKTIAQEFSVSMFVYATFGSFRTFSCNVIPYHSASLGHLRGS